MKKTMKYLSMAALVVMGTILASCAKNETPEVAEHAAEDNIVVCTTSVSFDKDATKALDNNGIKTFATGDRIAVIYKNTSSQTVKAVSEPLPSGSYDHTATFTVTLTNPKENSAVRIIYPANMAASTVAAKGGVYAEATINYAALESQDGTLATLSSSLDLAVYDGNLNGTDLPADPALCNKLAICEYTLKNSDGTSNITNTITGMTVSDGIHDYSVSRTPAAGPVYVAIRPTDNAIINYSATDGVDVYEKTVTGKTYGAGEMYPLGLRMTKYNELTTPLTFVAREDGFQLTFISNITPLPSLQYSINGGEWTDFTLKEPTSPAMPWQGNSPVINAGESISFRAKNTNGAFSDGTSAQSSFNLGKSSYIYGNVMSLLSKDNFATEKTVPDNAFFNLFYYQTYISNHPFKTLALPATTLGTRCYKEMFESCSGLTTAPDLPATTLVEECYTGMFKGCTNLSSITCLATNISATYCTYDWLYNVAGTGTFTAANSSVGWASGDNGIPNGWTRVNLN